MRIILYLFQNITADEKKIITKLIRKHSDVMVVTNV